MSGNQIGKPLVLAVKVQESITVPAEVRLELEELRWVTISETTAGDMGTLSTRCIKDCLKDFVKLAEAPSDEILRFANKYGPLGIAPMVEAEIGDGGSFVKRKYREPVALYRSLAQRASSIVRVMQCLRSRKSVSVELANEMFPSWFREALAKQVDSTTSLAKQVDSTTSLAKQVDSTTSLGTYNKLLYASVSWQHSATTRFDVSSHEEGPGEWKEGQFQINWPHPLINFGHWDDGFQWDEDMYCHFEGGNDGTPLEADRSNFDLLRCLRPEQVAWLFQSGEPYDVFWENTIQQIPNLKQRPSPLFNALAFQLMQAITVEEGTFFCASCGEMNSRFLSNGRMPRTDRAEFCSPKCRREERKKKDRCRKAAAASAKMH